MRHRSKVLLNLTAAFVLVLSLAWLVLAQTGSKDRLSGRIEEKATARVTGTVHRMARPEYDRGRADASFTMQHVTLVFRQTPAQQAELTTLLREQSDPSSANYHRWLSPEEYAAQFGLSESDINSIVSWLNARGFRIEETARSRSFVAFTGSVQQVESAFATQIHRYEVNGEIHYANATDPSVPAALAGVISGFRSLNDFRLKPRYVSKRVVDEPRFTSSVTGNHFIVPDDFATIYDLQTLYARGINGTGQKIAIMGQTDISLIDTRAFLAAAGLAANDPTVVLVPGSANPGTSANDLPEADLDLEWTMAVARRASITFVNSSDVNTSLQYAIDQNLAPVLSTSYGDCEPNFASSDVATMVTLTQQANAQGQTILAPGSDSGATDCDGDLSGETAATLGLAVDFPASLPYVTGVGGSEFNEVAPTWNSGNQLFGTFLGRTQPAYWSASNNGLSGSALSYIPEMAWNDSASTGSILGGGGGQSILFGKPSWQAGPGVPNDAARDVPDISLAASPQFDGFLICTGLFNSNGVLAGHSCVNGFRYSDNTLYVVGGTSVSTPSFAGVVALINQVTSSAQGNINPVLYALAAIPANVASVNSTRATIFHDITVGGNAMPCVDGTPDCPAGGGYIGYSAGPGYDLATGLGSVDVANLLASWTSVTPHTVSLPRH